LDHERLGQVDEFLRELLDKLGRRDHPVRDVVPEDPLREYPLSTPTASGTRKLLPMERRAVSAGTVVCARGARSYSEKLPPSEPM
jgi:hypothetical protein